MVQYNQNIMFDPQQEADAKRKRMLAEQLVKKGNEPLKNETAGGMTVIRSPWENIDQATNKYLGEYQLGEADRADSEVTKSRQKLMGEALGQLKDNPQAAAQMLSQDPNMMDVSLKLYGDALSRDRAEALRREGWSQQMRMQQMPTAEMRNFDYYRNLAPEQQQAYQEYRMSGTRAGSIPAPMQIANRMYELQQIASNPNISQAEKAEATAQYNLLGQAAKTYGFAPGTQVNFDVNSPVPPIGGQQPTQGILSEQPNMTPNGSSNMPQNMSMPISQPQINTVPGFGNAVADIAAQKAGAEAKAKMLGGAMPANIVKEQNDIVDKVNVAQSLEANMNKFVGQIDAGQLDLGLMANLENMARNNVGMSTEQSRNLSSFKSSLERLRNESLRLNTGVQTDGDAQRAWNELIQSINDPQVVRQRLTEIAEINKKGAQLQNQKLNLMRNEYGRGELNIPNINLPQQSGQPQIKFLGFE